MRSISLVVDISNYVMLELGQPLHFYDADKLTGAITVRRANPDETLKTLDAKDRKLHAEDLLITDESGAIGIAGVMGGSATEVSGRHHHGAHRGRALRAESPLPARAAATSCPPRRRSASSAAWTGTSPTWLPSAPWTCWSSWPAAPPPPRSPTRAPSPRPWSSSCPPGFASALIGIDYTEEQITWALGEIGAEIAERRRRLPGHRAVLAPGPGHQAGPCRGNRPPGGLPPDPGDAAHGPSGPRPAPACSPSAAASWRPWPTPD